MSRRTDVAGCRPPVEQQQPVASVEEGVLTERRVEEFRRRAERLAEVQRLPESHEQIEVMLVKRLSWHCDTPQLNSFVTF